MAVQFARQKFRTLLSANCAFPAAHNRRKIKIITNRSGHETPPKIVQRSLQVFNNNVLLCITSGALSVIQQKTFFCFRGLTRFLCQRYNLQPLTRKPSYFCANKDVKNSIHEVQPRDYSSLINFANCKICSEVYLEWSSCRTTKHRLENQQTASGSRDSTQMAP